jgi:hypothetical protein
LGSTCSGLSERERPMRFTVDGCVVREVTTGLEADFVDAEAAADAAKEMNERPKIAEWFRWHRPLVTVKDDGGDAA